MYRITVNSLGPFLFSRKKNARGEKCVQWKEKKKTVALSRERNNKMCKTAALFEKKLRQCFFLNSRD
jgi:hypothetical protein